MLKRLSGLPPSHTTMMDLGNARSSPCIARLRLSCAGAQTGLLLCVADRHPGIFKTLAAGKLENRSSEFGEDSIEVWAAITVSVNPLPP